MDYSALKFSKLINKIDAKKIAVSLFFIYQFNLSYAVDQAIQLEEINVKGYSSEDKGKTTEETLNLFEIEKRDARASYFLLNNFSSVDTSNMGINPSTAVSIRGLRDFGRVNMSIDGMRQNFQNSYHNQYNGHMYVDTSLLSKVVVTKGPSSKMGGATVSGGVVDFKLMDFNDVLSADKKWGGFLKGNTGITRYRNGQKFSGSFGLAFKPTEKYGVMGVFSYRNIDDYRTGANKTKGAIIKNASAGGFPIKYIDQNIYFPSTKTINQQQESYSGLVRVFYAPTEEHQFKLSYDFLSAQHPSGGGKAFGLNRGYTTYYDPSIDLWRFNKDAEDEARSFTDSIHRYAVNFNYRFNPATALVDLTLNTYINHTKMDKIYPKTTESNGLLTQEMIDEGFFYGPFKRYKSQTVSFSTKTKGFNLNNQAIFDINDKMFVKLNTGIEAFSDRTNPKENYSITGSVMGVGTTPPGKRSIQSFYLNAELFYDELFQLYSGVRYDKFHLTGKALLDTTSFKSGFRNNMGLVQARYVKDVDMSGSAWSPTAGFSFTPIREVEVFGRYGKSWRPPAITEVISFGGTPSMSLLTPLGSTSSFSYPNPYLKPETSKGFDFGLNLKFDGLFVEHDKFRIGITSYRQEIKNYISYHTQVLGPQDGDKFLLPFGDKAKEYVFPINAYPYSAAYINRTDPVKINGLELALNYDSGKYYVNLIASKIKTQEFDKKFDAWIWKDYPNQYNRDHVYLPGYTMGGDFPVTKKVILNVGGRFWDNKLDTGVILTHYGKTNYNQYGNFLNFVRVKTIFAPYNHPSRNVVDFYAYYKYRKNFKVKFNVENLTNVAYAPPLSYDAAMAPGRTVTLGFEYRF